MKSPWFSLNHISHLATVEIRVVRLGYFQNLYLSFAIVEITHGVTANRDDTDFHHAKPQILYKVYLVHLKPFYDCKGQNVDILAKVHVHVYLVHLKVEHCQTLCVVSTFTGQIFVWVNCFWLVKALSCIDEFQINEINVDLRTSGFLITRFSVLTHALYDESNESFYCLPHIGVVTWHREPRFQKCPSVGENSQLTDSTITQLFCK